MNLLFLLKKNYNYDYPEYFPLKNSTGLFNSANFVAEALKKYLHQEVEVEICVDANEIDKYISIHKPNICFLEAIWVTPEKLEELVKLHSSVKFVIRVHSNVPFLATEGVAIDWIKKYIDIDNVSVAFNNKETDTNFKLAGINGIYLPNIYINDKAKFLDKSDKFFDILKSLKSYSLPGIVNIGCFGAIRPMKNQLLQAMAAIGFADKNDLILNFHINGTRVEQKGDVVLRNIRALFVGLKHNLVEHQWMPHAKFLKLIEKMDIGMQLSMTESFNIVTADFVSKHIPIIVSPDISWMSWITKVGPFNIKEIIARLEIALTYKKLFNTVSSYSLQDYNVDAIDSWYNYLLKN